MARSRIRRVEATSAPESQPSVHEEIFRSLLQTPHREIDEILQVHLRQFERDPNFYGKVAFWAAGLGNNAVRDINEVFLAILFHSQFKEHKDAAFVMLQDLPPYQVVRVGNLFTGYDEQARYASYEKQPVNANGVTVERARFSKNHPDVSLRGKEIPVQKIELSPKSKMLHALVKKGLLKQSDTSFTVTAYCVHHQCLNNRHFKSMFRKAVQHYLSTLEQNNVRMEGALLRARKAMKQLYSRSNRLPQNDERGWVNEYLFNGKTQPGTRLDALKKLAATKDPAEQSKIILDNKLPYPLVVSAISNMTPSMLVALIEVMSPQELMSNLSVLQKRGAMDNIELKALIESKLKTIQKSTKVRVDAMKGATAAKLIDNLDADIRSTLIDVTDDQLKRHGEIRAKTVLMIDKSGSMSSAIELGKQVASAIAQACVENNAPITYLFDSQPVPIIWNDVDGDIAKKSSWDKKLAMFRANGGTAPGGVIRSLISQHIAVEQIVIITDEEENHDADKFVKCMKDYEKTIGTLPSVVIVRIGSSNQMEKECKSSGINVEVVPVADIDHVSMPNLIKILSRKSLFDTIQEILSLTLPRLNTVVTTSVTAVHAN